MRYSIGYGFLFFAKNIGKNLSIKYGEILFDSAKEERKIHIFRKKTRNY